MRPMKSLLPKEPISTGSRLASALFVSDKRGASLANFNTGKKLNPVIAPLILAGSVLAAGGLGKGTSRPQSVGEITPFNAMSLVNRDVPPAEQAQHPTMLADGTAGNIETSQAPTLGADGSMVFGMHNKRSGGYI